VKLGGRSDSHIWKCWSGVKAGEEVVVAANFLIDAESNLKAAVGGFRALGPWRLHRSPERTATSLRQLAPKPAGSPGRRDRWTSVDAKAGTVSLSHGPVASLKWPAMTMEFKVANPSLLQALKPGAKVDVEFVERQPGEWVITSAVPRPARRPRRRRRLDAIPDLSDVQVIVVTEYPGQNPQVVDDQVTYPLASALLAVPGATDVRGVSMFELSFCYVLFEDGTDIYWARSRVLEYLSTIRTACRPACSRSSARTPRASVGSTSTRWSPIATTSPNCARSRTTTCAIR
jgi:Cu/Ag efflux protein CusF